jgi:hypothetical protein
MKTGTYRALVPAVLVLALAACGDNAQPAYEAEQSDMVVESPGASDVPVVLPNTPMTGAADASAADSAAPAKPQ